MFSTQLQVSVKFHFQSSVSDFEGSMLRIGQKWNMEVFSLVSNHQTLQQWTVNKVFRSFTEVKGAMPQFKHILLQVKVLCSKYTNILIQVHKYYQLNIQVYSFCIQNVAPVKFYK